MDNKANPEWFLWLLLALAVVIGGLLIVVIIKCAFGMHKWKKTLEGPEYAVPAMVMGKEKRVMSQRILGHLPFEAAPEERFFMTFATEPSGMLTMEVPEEIYNELQEDSAGILVYLGDRFLRFDRKIEDPAEEEQPETWPDINM